MSSLSSTMELLNETTNLMLSKGLEIRSPHIPYMQEVEVIEEHRFLSEWFGEQRPLTALEITHLYSNILTNMLGEAIVTGFGQTAKLKEVRNYMSRGKEISKKHVEIFSKHLHTNDLPVPEPWYAEVYEVTEAPFSDRLMMHHVALMNSNSVTNYGSAISFMQRRDLVVDMARLSAEVAQYAADGARILIKHKCLEKPPQAANRDELMN